MKFIKIIKFCAYSVHGIFLLWVTQVISDQFDIPYSLAMVFVFLMSDIPHAVAWMDKKMNPENSGF